METTSLLSPVEAIDVIQEASEKIAARAAVLAKLAEGQSSVHSEWGTMNPQLAAQFWRGVEMLELENLEDLQALTVAASALYDQKGGAR